MRKICLVHPVLFGIFPILFLYAQNARKMNLSDIFSPLLLTIGIIMALTLLAGMILRSMYKGALCASLLAALFFSYGHVIAALPTFRYRVGDSILGPNGVILPLWLLVLIIGIWTLIKARWDLRGITKILAQLGLLLVAVQIVQGGYVIASRADSHSIGPTNLPGSTVSPDRLPDVYYIIMDAYARSDVLRDIYKVDNSAFIEYLEENGFEVADSSFANYPQTLMSVAATLNLDYVNNIARFDTASTDRIQLARHLWDNKVFRTFKKFGYTTVAFETTASTYTESMKADVILSTVGGRSEFWEILISTTPLPLIPSDKISSDESHRRLVLSIFEKLPRITEAKSPKFVFAHILSPHKPFVFKRDGRPTTDIKSYIPVEYISSYADQITFITGILKQTISEILEHHSDHPPIIILQGDHGPRSGMDWLSMEKNNLKEIFAILNAVYLPGVDDPVIYESISPINTFRVIFNEYFDAELDLLPDKSYYFYNTRPFDFRLVTSDRLENYRGMYDHLVEKDFESLPTLDRLILFENNLTGRPLADCFADSSRIIAFNEGNVIMPDCRLSRIAALHFLFEAAFIPQSEMDDDYSLELKFYRNKTDTTEATIPSQVYHTENFIPSFPFSAMTTRAPSYIGHVFRLSFMPDRYTVNLVLPDGHRDPGTSIDAPARYFKFIDNPE